MLQNTYLSCLLSPNYLKNTMFVVESKSVVLRNYMYVTALFKMM